MIYEGYGDHRGCTNTLYFLYFLANGSMNPDVLWPKTFLIPREIIPQSFSSSGLVVSEKLGNKQTHKLTYLHFIAFIE